MRQWPVEWQYYKLSGPRIWDIVASDTKATAMQVDSLATTVLHRPHSLALRSALCPLTHELTPLSTGIALKPYVSPLCLSVHGRTIFRY